MYHLRWMAQTQFYSWTKTLAERNLTKLRINLSLIRHRQHFIILHLIQLFLLQIWINYRNMLQAIMDSSHNNKIRLERGRKLNPLRVPVDLSGMSKHRGSIICKHKINKYITSNHHNSKWIWINRRITDNKPPKLIIRRIKISIYNRSLSSIWSEAARSWVLGPFNDFKIIAIYYIFLRV